MNNKLKELKDKRDAAWDYWMSIDVVDEDTFCAMEEAWDDYINVRNTVGYELSKEYNKRVITALALSVLLLSITIYSFYHSVSMRNDCTEAGGLWIDAECVQPLKSEGTVGKVRE